MSALTYTSDVAARVLASISTGRSLRATCADMGLDEGTVRSWAVADRDGFMGAYERARIVGCHVLADEILSIADAADDKDSAAAARVQCENRRWLLSKLLPRTYGDRLTVENAGTPGTVIVVQTGVSRTPGEPAASVIEGVPDAG